MRTVAAGEDGQAASKRERVANQRKDACPLRGSKERGQADVRKLAGLVQIQKSMRNVHYSKGILHPQSVRRRDVTGIPAHTRRNSR